MVEILTLLLGIGVGVAIMAVLRALWGLAARPDPRVALEPTSAFGWETDRNRFSASSDRDRPREISEIVADPPSRAAEPARLSVEIREPAPEAPVRNPVIRVPGRVVVDGSTLLLSQRIVLHLQRVGAFELHDVAPREASQAGMVDAIGVRQSSLTKVLVRLVAAGVLHEGRTHVRGEPRRLKVYRLTPLGESLARDIRRASADGARPVGPRSWDLTPRP